MNVLKNITHATENVNKVMNVLKNITHATENVKCNTWYRKWHKIFSYNSMYSYYELIIKLCASVQWSSIWGT